MAGGIINSLEKRKTQPHKLLLLLSIIVVLTSFAFSLHDNNGQLSISILPEAPKENDPILVSLALKNPAPIEMPTDYQLFVNGKLAMEGNTQLPPNGIMKYEYIYKNPVQIGEQIVFVAKSSSGDEVFEDVISYPSYPPVVWSSFVSFASFSENVMSYMATMGHFKESFADKLTLNLGAIFSVVLIILLIYLELTEPHLFEKSMTTINNLRLRFARLAGVLFIIFVGMVLAQIAVILGTV